MRQLNPDARGAGLGFKTLHHRFESALGLVRIEAEASRRDPADRLDASCFDEDQACSRQRELSQMQPMPFGGNAIDSAVLAHWRNDDAIGQSEAAKPGALE